MTFLRNFWAQKSSKKSNFFFAQNCHQIVFKCFHVFPGDSSTPKHLFYGVCYDTNPQIFQIIRGRENNIETSEFKFYSKFPIFSFDINCHNFEIKQPFYFLDMISSAYSFRNMVHKNGVLGSKSHQGRLDNMWKPPGNNFERKKIDFFDDFQAQKFRRDFIYIP